MPLVQSAELSSFESGLRVSLGEIVITPGAASVLSQDEIRKAILRHSRGDWGDLDLEDAQSNDLHLQQGGPIASIYRSSTGQKFYVVTESDRATTTVLLPSEY